jgi:hypothetical protein
VKNASASGQILGENRTIQAVNKMLPKNPLSRFCAARRRAKFSAKTD